MEEISRERGDIGEPAGPLTADPQTVQPGTQLHIVLLGPPGGVATAEFVPIAAMSADTREGPQAA